MVNTPQCQKILFATRVGICKQNHWMCAYDMMNTAIEVNGIPSDNERRNMCKVKIASGIWYSEILIAMHTGWNNLICDITKPCTESNCTLIMWYQVPLRDWLTISKNRLNLTRIEYGNNVLECRHWNGFVIFHMD